VPTPVRGRCLGIPRSAGCLAGGTRPMKTACACRCLTGRAVRCVVTSAERFPGDLAPILERIAMSSESRLETVSKFGRLFHRAAALVSLGVGSILDTWHVGSSILSSTTSWHDQFEWNSLTRFTT
jgi:hypothetical protein